MRVVKGPAFITTWAFVAVSAASVIVGTTSAYVQAKNAKDMMDYNAEVENIKAKDAANIGSQQAADTRARARKITAAQNEAGAASGLDMNYGTPLGLLVETAGIGEKEALTVMNNAQRQAWGHQSQAGLDRAQGQAAMTQGYMNMAGSALSGASSVYSTGRSSKLWG